MYDSISMIVKNCDNINFDSISDIKDVLNRKSGELETKGLLKNLYIKISGDTVFISGSISKFYHNNNLSQLTRGDTEKALKYIGATLNIPIETALIWRLDLATNIIVNESPNNYLNCFGSLNRFQKDIYSKTGLYYRQNFKTLVLYDKISEMKRKKEQVPELFQALNVLRIELRFKKRLRAAFKQKEIFASDLYNESFYIKAIKQFELLFTMIERKKMNKITDETLKNIDAKNLIQYFANEYLKEFGSENAISLIEQAQNNKKIDRVKAYRLRNKIKEIASLPDFTEPSSLIIELDSKFKRAISNYR